MAVGQVRLGLVRLKTLLSSPEALLDKKETSIQQRLQVVDCLMLGLNLFASSSSAGGPRPLEGLGVWSQIPAGQSIVDWPASSLHCFASASMAVNAGKLSCTCGCCFVLKCKRCSLPALCLLLRTSF